MRVQAPPVIEAGEQMLADTVHPQHREAGEVMLSKPRMAQFSPGEMLPAQRRRHPLPRQVHGVTFRHSYLSTARWNSPGSATTLNNPLNKLLAEPGMAWRGCVPPKQQPSATPVRPPAEASRLTEIEGTHARPYPGPNTHRGGRGGQLTALLMIPATGWDKRSGDGAHHGLKTWTTASISTGISNGSSAIPTADRPRAGRCRTPEPASRNSRR